MSAPVTLRDALRGARGALAGASSTPGLDAEILLGHVTGRDTAALLRDDAEPLAPAAASRLRALVRRRAAGEPIAHLTGEREFWSLTFRVSPRTLIPRPDTETLVQAALECIEAEAACRVLDLGTGTGNIAVALALARPASVVTAVDIDDAAVALASDNARRLGAGNVEVIPGDWFDGVGTRSFDVVVSNPPYVAAGDPHLAAGDVAREPRHALVAGLDGLDDIRRIVRDAPAHLLEGGHLLLEHGVEQANAVRVLLAAEGYVDIATHRDLGGRERVTAGRRVGQAPTRRSPPGNRRTRTAA